MDKIILFFDKIKKFLFPIFLFLFAFFMAWRIQDIKFKKKKYEFNQEKLEFFKKINIEKKKVVEKEKKQAMINQIFENLNAKAVLIKKFNQEEEIYSKNKNQTLPIASLTKIVNAITALDLIEDKVYITERALKTEGSYGLKNNEIFNKNDAIKYMLIQSVNDIASAISFGSGPDFYKHWKKFMDKMNIFPQKLNLESTLFFSENGLDINDHILGSYSSAKDIAKIVEYFYSQYPEIAKETTFKETKVCSQLSCHWITNTNPLLEKYPEIIFSKTGFTQKAGGSVVVILEIKKEKYTVVVLNSTKEGRFEVLSTIINKLKLLKEKEKI